MFKRLDREWTVDKLLIEDYLDKLNNEFDGDLAPLRWDVGNRYDSSWVTVELILEGGIRKEELKDIVKLMERIDKKFGDGKSVLFGDSSLPEEDMIIVFPIKLKDILEDENTDN